jgi:hypothetical protein
VRRASDSEPRPGGGVAERWRSAVGPVARTFPAAVEADG